MVPKVRVCAHEMRVPAGGDRRSAGGSRPRPRLRSDGVHTSPRPQRRLLSVM